LQKETDAAFDEKMEKMLLEVEMETANALSNLNLTDNVTTNFPAK